MITNEKIDNLSKRRALLLYSEARKCLIQKFSFELVNKILKPIKPLVSDLSREMDFEKLELLKKGLKKMVRFSQKPALRVIVNKKIKNK